jgi:hypothetical protein
LALIMPPSGGSKFKGPRQRPLLPLRAVHVLKPPALPGDTYSASQARTISTRRISIGRPGSRKRRANRTSRRGAHGDNAGRPKAGSAKRGDPGYSTGTLRVPTNDDPAFRGSKGRKEAGPPPVRPAPTAEESARLRHQLIADLKQLPSRRTGFTRTLRSRTP